MPLVPPFLFGDAQGMDLLQGAGMFARSTELINELRAELQAERIRIAQLRDEMLTQEELAALFDVYEEFGQ